MSTIVHGIIGYFFLLTIRILVRRPGAQMTMFDFVLIFLIGGIIILATMGSDHSEINSVSAVVTVGLLHRLVSGLKQRSPKFAAIVDGKPLVLIKNGEWQTETMRKMCVQDTDVMTAARQKGAKSLREVKYAVLERNGAISIIENSG